MCPKDEMAYPQEIGYNGTQKRSIMKRTALLLVATLLLLGGCSRLTKENYDKVESGMKYEEVVKLIGKPDRCSEAIGVTSCVWKSGETEVQATFIGNKLTIITGSDLK